MKAPEIVPVGASDKWPAGRPAAAGSAFNWKAWPLQCDWGALVLSSKLTKVQTERIERARAAGDNTGTIASLSRRSDDHGAATAKYWREPKKTAMVSIENAEAGRKSTEKRARLRRGTL